MIKLEQRLASEGLIANKKKRGGGRNFHKLRVSKESRVKAIEALGIIEASKKLKERYALELIFWDDASTVYIDLCFQRRLNLTDKEAVELLPKISLRDTVLENTCLEPIVCNNTSKYRTVDGSCNNLANPNWGQANTIFERLLPAHYGNGAP